MASCHIRPPMSMDSQKWARWQYHPPGWYCNLAHVRQSINIGGLVWYDAITPHTFKYSSEKDSIRCVHIWSQTFVWSCLLSCMWAASEKGPPKMGVDTDEMGGRHLYAKWPCLIKNDFFSKTRRFWTRLVLSCSEPGLKCDDVAARLHASPPQSPSTKQTWIYSLFCL